MKLRKLFESTWNKLDHEAFENAKPNLDKVLKDHKKLLKELNPLKRKYNKIFNELVHVENGQGQNYDEIESIKGKLKVIDDKITKSEKEVKRLEKIYYELLRMVKN